MKKFIPIIVLSIVAILMVIALAFSFINDSHNNEASGLNIVESTDTILNVYDNIYTLEDAKVRNSLVSYINSGGVNSAIIDGKSYIIVSSGTETISDIEITKSTSEDGSLKIYVDFNGNDTTESKLRYKIIEVSSLDNIYIIQGNKVLLAGKNLSQRQLTASSETIDMGIVSIIKVDNKVYDYANNKIYTNIKGLTDGIYNVSIYNSSVASQTPLNGILVDRCEIVESDGRMYTVRIGNTLELQISLDKLNMQPGEIVKIEMNCTSGKFSGKVVLDSYA